MERARDTFRATLERRLAALRREEADLRQQFVATRARLQEIQRRLAATEQLYDLELGAGAPTDPEAADSASRRFAGLSWNKAVVQALAEAAAPVPLGELWRVLEDGGFQSKSMDPTRTLRVVLSRSPDVVSSERGVYELRRDFRGEGT